MHQGKNKIVIVLTSHSQLGDSGKKTGYHLEELAVPYLELKRAGAEIVIASPGGGKPPVDPKSAGKDSPEIQEFLQDPEAAKKLAHTLLLTDIPDDIDVLFFPGGHGPMWDLAESDEVKDRVEAVWRDGGIIAALCHGPAALVRALDESGEPLVRGKRIVSFTDAEERAAGSFELVPFHLEEKLRKLGARFEHGGNGAAHVVRDGRLVTGQNPASAKAVAQEVLRELELLDAARSSQERKSREAAEMENDSRGPSNIGRVAPPAEREDDTLPWGMTVDRRKQTQANAERHRTAQTSTATGETRWQASADAARAADESRDEQIFEGNREGESDAGEIYNRKEPAMSRPGAQGTPEVDGNRSTSAEEDRKLRADRGEVSQRSRRQEIDDGAELAEKHEGELLHDDRISREKKSRGGKSQGGKAARGNPERKQSRSEEEKNPALDAAHMIDPQTDKQNPPRRR